MAHPTYGFLTYKGSGSRLLRGVDDDWVNVQAREGQTGWKEGLLFTRHYAYQRDGANGAQHLYRYEATRLEGLDRVAEAFGKTDDEARQALYEQLKRKGVMPAGEEG
jgi:hypothetical protein